MLMTNELLDDARGLLTREQCAQRLANVMNQEVLVWDEEAREYRPIAWPEVSE